MIFNQYLYNRNHSHAESNFISSLTIGTAAVAGGTGAIWATSATAAPETE